MIEAFKNVCYYLIVIYYKIYFLVKGIDEDGYWKNKLNNIDFDKYVRLGLIVLQTRDNINFKIFAFDYDYFDNYWGFSWNYEKEKVEESYCNLGAKYCGKLWNQYFWKGFILK